MTWLFGTPTFIAAGLVFLVEPMIAKALLPTFGGTPQVWAASMVFFQASLLAGYAYAHLATSLAADPRWLSLDGLPRTVVWTDDFSDILSILRR